MDRIVLSNFRVVNVDCCKLREYDNVEISYQESEDWEGLISKLKINDNNQFGTLTYSMKNTKYGMREYARVDMTVNDPVTGNLQNTSIETCKERIITIKEYLADKYGVFIETEEVRISKMEINVTFKIQESFFKYHRVLNLMMYNLPDYYRKISEVKKKNIKDKRMESETFYRGNNSMQIKIYDKKRQLSDTIGYSTEDELMRIEYTLLSAQKVREVFGTSRLSDIKDSQIRQYYIKQFNKLFERRYRMWRDKNQNWLYQRIVFHKKQSRNNWQINLLSECRNLEQKNQVPVLLDIEDLFEQMKLIDQSGHFSRIKRSICQKCEENDVYLQGDSNKVEEIFACVNQIYQRSLE